MPSRPTARASACRRCASASPPCTALRPAWSSPRPTMPKAARWPPCASPFESRAMNPTALIAEDEPLLAANLQAELARLWPELGIVASVGHGEAAVDKGLALQPDVMFLDIRMPGMSGL